MLGGVSVIGSDSAVGVINELVVKGQKVYVIVSFGKPQIVLIYALFGDSPGSCFLVVQGCLVVTKTEGHLIPRAFVRYKNQQSGGLVEV